MSPLPELGSRFELVDLEGRRHRLVDAVESGAVALFFFAPECAASGVAAPFVELIWEGYRDHVSAEETRLTVLGIGIGEEAAVRSSLEKYGWSFPVLLDRDGEVSRAYRVESTPTLCLLRGRERLRTDAEAVPEAEGYRIVDRVAGWSREGYELFAEEIAQRIGTLPVELYGGRPDVPDSLPG